jgi:tetratricopeptide (TPR) repeat protein
MAQWRLLTTSTTKRCENMWNFVKGIPTRLARKVLAQWRQEAQADVMHQRTSSIRNTQAGRATRIVNPIFVCLLGVGTLNPVVVVFAAERCPATNATKVVSVQGNVTFSVINNAALTPAKLNDILCVGDTVRVGAKSRAVLRLSNETTVPLDQNTIFQLKQAISEKEPTLIDLLQGAIHVITRTPKPFKVNTPFLNAVVEGTEFYVGVDSAEARVAVIEGKVNVSNEQGAVLLTDNEAATAKKGQAPQKTLTIKPRDAVQWALYYPPLFDPRSRSGGQNLSASHDLYSQGKITDAIESLNAISGAERNGDYYSYRAGLLLLVGRADEAEPDIETALRENGNNTDALSLKAIIAIVRNDKAKALELANQAVNIDDKSASARIALSYALQANFKIEDALNAARVATERDANNALAWARVAELELSIPNYEKSKEAAEKAVTLNPNLARTQSVLGFANLTRIDIKAAKRNFDRAIELDQADPLPRLGLGLATIREGNLAEGREQIEIAASLDPENSLIRSYLGKAYYEEKRGDKAAKQFDLAKKRDPKDPTPYFYSAINKLSENSPVEGLQDLNQSIQLNGGRAVFRSNLLLEEDTSSKNVGSATIFGALGFRQQWLTQGSREASYDPSSFVAHDFLAAAFENVPRHDLAQQSETLQAQLMRPVSFRPVAPTLTEADQQNAGFLKSIDFATPGLNEFTSLFSANRVGLNLSGLSGTKNTFGDRLTIFGLYNRTSFSLSQTHYQTDGFRENNDFKKNIYNGFLQHDLSPSLSLQAELRKFDSDRGDQFLRFDRGLFFPERGEFDGAYYRLGARWKPINNSTFLISAIHTNADNIAKAPDLRIVESFVMDSAELQYSYRGNAINLIGGGGQYRQRKDVETSFNTQGSDTTDAQNLYIYSSFKHVLPGLQLQLAGSYDVVESEFGITADNQRQFSPKVGVIWDVTPGTTFRFAHLRTVKRHFLLAQTLEPTQIAGFNQLFDDPNGTSTQRSGAGLDVKINPSLYTGLEATIRRLRVPQDGEFFLWKERLAHAYVNWVPTTWLTTSLALEYEKLTRDPLFISADLFLDVTTKSIPFNVTISRNLWSARMTTTFVSQRGHFFFAPLGSESAADSSKFTMTDFSVSRSIGRNKGSIGLEIKNVLDKGYRFQETDVVHPRFSTQRLFLLKGIAQF